MNGYINSAVDKIRERSGLDKITLLGVCQGGTFSVMYAAIHPEKVKNLVTLVTPVNFDTDKGLLHLWAKSLDVDKIVDYYGIVPGDYLNSGFLFTDPFRQFMKDCYQKNLLIKNEMTLDGKGDEKTESGNEELPELAKEKTVEQNRKKRKSKVNKK